MDTFFSRSRTEEDAFRLKPCFLFNRVRFCVKMSQSLCEKTDVNR